MRSLFPGCEMFFVFIVEISKLMKTGAGGEDFLAAIAGECARTMALGRTESACERVWLAGSTATVSATRAGLKSTPDAKSV